MHIVRFTSPKTGDGLGVLDAAGVAPLADHDTMSALLRQPLPDIRHLLAVATRAPTRLDPERLGLLPPVDGRMEVWGAGVTYARSRDARVEESGRREVYGDVYDADRPELFHKAVAWRVSGDGSSPALRGDAPDHVPEPELALLVNRHAEIVGATVCDDLTARSIEGTNPLYLPQAKIFGTSCVLAPAVRPWWEIATPEGLGISLRIVRDGETVFAASTDTSQIVRSFAELVEWTYLELDFPDGMVLTTGTGIVPPLDAGLTGGDGVHITIDEVGELSHLVAKQPA